MMQECFFCKKDGLEYYNEDKKILSCKNCGILFSESKSQNYPSILNFNKNSPNKIKLLLQKRLSAIIAGEYLEYLKTKTNMEFKNALDIGSGFGYFVRELNDEGIDAYGIESDNSLFEHCITKKVQFEIFNENFVTHKQFDLISINQALYYFPDVLSILKKIQSMLTNDGHVLIITVNPESSFRKKFKIWTQGCCICLSKQNFSSIKDNLGLELVDCTTYDDNLYKDVFLRKRKKLNFLKYFIHLLAYILKIKKIQLPNIDGVHNFIVLKKVKKI
jgi:SAM-dependent methyltransferase